MVSKCCWRESAKRSPEAETETSDDGKKETETDCHETESNAGSTTALLSNYEDDCDKQLEITDLTTEAKNNQNTGSCI